MSNLEATATVEICSGDESGPVFQLLESRPVQLTQRFSTEAQQFSTEAQRSSTNTGRSAPPVVVNRYLPTKGRRMVGAWCFLDLLGPAGRRDAAGMRIGPHPHIGLQTVTWLLDGMVRHRDSLGSDQLIRPGQLSLMTAGRGIAHAENSQSQQDPRLHALQLWVALPDAERWRPPDFAHHDDLPRCDGAGFSGTVLLGEFAGVTSPAAVYTPIAGAQLDLTAEAVSELPLRPDWEYAVLALTGDVMIDGCRLPEAGLAYLGAGRTVLPVTHGRDSVARVLVLGGEPFGEQIVMWWNFVARSHAEISQARAEWMDSDAADRRFGRVSYEGPAIPAPPIPPVTLKPRGRS